MCTDNYTLFPVASQGGEASSSRFRQEPVTVEEALRRHDGLVHAFIQRQGGGAISYEEALHAGRIGLWRAILGYDPSKGTRFSTYAWVAICRHVNQAAMESREATDRRLSDAPGKGWYMMDLEGELDRGWIDGALYGLVGRLPDRLQQIIVARYGLGDHPFCTLEQVGAALGVTAERVRQLQQEALAWLRHPAHSGRLRQLVDKNRAVDYRQALAQNAALRRSRRRGR
jgi:RNA polymerase sigma factor (sigma-70 family)